MPSLGSARRHGASADQLGGVGTLARWYLGPAAQPPTTSIKQARAANLTEVRNLLQILSSKMKKPQCIVRIRKNGAGLQFFTWFPCSAKADHTSSYWIINRVQVSNQSLMDSAVMARFDA
jgi:hypothetical protein